MAGVVTTESSVKNESVVLEESWDLAVPHLGSKTWLWPGCWVWVGAEGVDASRTAAREEPDLDVLWLPVRDINAASGTVEIDTVVARLFHDD